MSTIELQQPAPHPLGMFQHPDAIPRTCATCKHWFHSHDDTGQCESPRNKEPGRGATIETCERGFSCIHHELNR